MSQNLRRIVDHTTVHVDNEGIIVGFEEEKWSALVQKRRMHVDFDLGGEHSPRRCITRSRARRGTSLNEAGNVALRTLLPRKAYDVSLLFGCYLSCNE